MFASNRQDTHSFKTRMWPRHFVSSWLFPYCRALEVYLSLRYQFKTPFLKKNDFRNPKLEVYLRHEIHFTLNNVFQPLFPEPTVAWPVNKRNKGLSKEGRYRSSTIIQDKFQMALRNTLSKSLNSFCFSIYRDDTGQAIKNRKVSWGLTGFSSLKGQFWRISGSMLLTL